MSADLAAKRGAIVNAAVLCAWDDDHAFAEYLAAAGNVPTDNWGAPIADSPEAGAMRAPFLNELKKARAGQAAAPAAGTTPWLPGAAFVLDAPEQVPAVWGRGTDVLWSEGESLLLTGPPGVGKSTLAQQLVRARLGLAADVLGYPVTDDGRRVLYLALDRPPQIARSMRRMFTDTEREVLQDRLRIVRALPFDLVAYPQRLGELAAEHDAGTLIIDSLKDAATKLTDDETGQKVTTAMRSVLETGCQTIGVHHHRKANGENKKPATLADVYGSAWITAGAGSVVTVWGQPGDVLVDLLHLKQPSEDVGPLQIAHDHRAGHTTLRETPTPWTLLMAAVVHGTTAPDVARAIHGKKASNSQIEKARRKLDGYVTAGQAKKREQSEPGAPVLYHPVMDGGTR